MKQTPTPTTSAGLALRRADFETLTEGLDYAARGDAGFNFFAARGELRQILTYRELRERARELAQRLVKLGLARGDRLMMVADTEPDFCVTFMATQYAGLVPVPELATSSDSSSSSVRNTRETLPGPGPGKP